VAAHAVLLVDHAEAVARIAAVEVFQQLAAGAQGITVSTLKEAERFVAEGITDILYAVAIAPGKRDHALGLSRHGCRLTLLVESVAGPAALARHGIEHGHCHAALIEVDTDGHRSGIRPDDATLLEVAAALSPGRSPC
jgi:D-serine deaminase-like pyridoxal phosphate-dependent protein